MKTKEQLEAMSHEELISYATKLQSESSMSEYYQQQNIRMREILAAIGIIYEAYKKA